MPLTALQVALLRTDPNMLLADHQQASAVEGASQALWACTVSRSGRLALLRAGGLELLGSLLFVSRQSLLVPVVGVIHQCITEIKTRHWKKCYSPRSTAGHPASL
ncbi:Armadillo repeat-containing protein 4 [Portunus trituberculatus]|uniref:Armadillo repeat-containing protein 4 n=1 Tax=Portunus trituberculatus TaxID=210409 RepID=A0A5B7K8J3_PORTR|nr:Armadillo repeat-containing protein 4 [Portunus trituberculatus]